MDRPTGIAMSGGRRSFACVRHLFLRVRLVGLVGVLRASSVRSVLRILHGHRVDDRRREVRIVMRDVRSRADLHRAHLSGQLKRVLLQFVLFKQKSKWKRSAARYVTSRARARPACTKSVRLTPDCFKSAWVKSIGNYLRRQNLLVWNGSLRWQDYRNARWLPVVLVGAQMRRRQVIAIVDGRHGRRRLHNRILRHPLSIAGHLQSNKTKILLNLHQKLNTEVVNVPVKSVYRSLE